MYYYALIADIKNSKKIKSRFNIQEKLNNVLNKINDIYTEEHIASKFVLTKGDEFQCLFKIPDKIFEIITVIETQMHPVKLRFSIGYGNILTNINKEQAIGSDGPAWWNAREGIEVLRYTQEKGIKELSNIKISGLENKAVMEIVNMCFVLLNKIKDKWTETQIEFIGGIISKTGLMSDIKQKKIAAELDIPADVVNKRLKISSYFDFALTYESIVQVVKNCNNSY